MILADIIKKYYKNKQDQRPLFDFSKLKITHITTYNSGLGDTALLTFNGKSNQKPIHIFANNKYWDTFCKFNSNLSKQINFMENYFPIENFGSLGSGNGHIINGIQRGLNIDVENKPRGYLYIDNKPECNINKIGLCFTTNNSGNFLINKGFNNPRNLNYNSLSIINDFINSSNYEFVQFGNVDVLNNTKVKNFIGRSIEESIIELSSCNYYIGLNSGFMHLSTALNIKSIILVNVPHPADFYLPILKNVAIYDLNWLYPQNVHLHEYGENELVKKINLDNIFRAINGDIYPFWKDDYLHLIKEKI